MLTCALCGQYAASRCCSSCQAALDLQLLSPDDQLWQTQIAGSPYILASKWAYRGQVREAVLAFKLKQQWCAGAWLVQQLLDDERVLQWVAEADMLMAAPSSLWSRIRGRYDLAALAAYSLAYHCGRALIESPRALLGNWQKQSRLSRKERMAGTAALSAKTWGPDYFAKKISREQSPRQLLILDDVVTTGQTLRAFAACFHGLNIRFLSLAAALRRTDELEKEPRKNPRFLGETLIFAPPKHVVKMRQGP